MRIAVDTLSQTLGGGVSVARHLVEALARQRPEAHLVLYCSVPALAEHRFPGNVEVRHRPELRSLPRRILWQQLRLPGVLRREGFDLLLALGGFAVAATPVPQLAVWQNPNVFTRVPIPWRGRTRAYIRLQRWAQGLSMRKAALNVFLTRDSVREAATRWRLGEIPHRVIHNGIAMPAQAALPEREQLGPPFVLAVGHAYFHKNYEALIDAMARLRGLEPEPIELRIAGGPVNPDYYRTLLHRIRERGLLDCVRFLGPTPPAEVARLYASARAYVVTSLLESFGLTPLEAMAHGLPVLASRASCIPEVCDDAALYCDPHDPEDIARQLRRLLKDEALRDDLRRRGFERVKQFSWESRAAEYWDAIDACLRDLHPGRASLQREVPRGAS